MRGSNGTIPSGISPRRRRLPAKARLFWKYQPEEGLEEVSIGFLAPIIDRFGTAKKIETALIETLLSCRLMPAGRLEPLIRYSSSKNKKDFLQRLPFLSSLPAKAADRGRAARAGPGAGRQPQGPAVTENSADAPTIRFRPDNGLQPAPGNIVHQRGKKMKRMYPRIILSLSNGLIESPAVYGTAGERTIYYQRSSCRDLIGRQRGPGWTWECRKTGTIRKQRAGSA